MTDEELLAQASALVPIYCDGFGAFRKLNGVFRCIGYELAGGANLNLIISLDGAERGTLAARAVLEEKPMPSIRIWNGAKLTH